MNVPAAAAEEENLHQIWRFYQPRQETDRHRAPNFSRKNVM